MKNTTLIFSLLLCVSKCLATAKHPIQTVLILKQRATIQSLLDEMRDSRSSHFAKPFSPAEITERLALSDKDYLTLLNKLKRRGFRVAHEDLTWNYSIVKSAIPALRKPSGPSCFSPRAASITRRPSPWFPRTCLLMSATRSTWTIG